MKRERREFALEELKVVTRDDGDPQIRGHAAVFNQLSEELFGFREKIAPGAFADTLKNGDDVRALINHDPNFVLGRSSAGTLSMEEDKRGLSVVIDPPTTTFASDLMVSMQRGDINQMSFGFETVDDIWETVNDENIRTLRKVRLFDVSVVTFPAYPQTDVGVRTMIWDGVGVDENELDRIFVRVRNGLELTDEDRVVLDTAIEKFTELRGEVVEPRLETETPTPRSRTTLLKLKQKQLQLEGEAQ